MDADAFVLHHGLIRRAASIRVNLLLFDPFLKERRSILVGKDSDLEEAIPCVTESNCDAD